MDAKPLVLPIDPVKVTTIVFLGASRLFTSLKTVLKVNGNFTWYFSDYLLNENISRMQVQSRSANFELVNNYASFLSITYKTIVGQSKSRYSGGLRNEVFYNNHYLDLVFYPTERQSISFQNSLYSNTVPKQQNQYFLAVNYRYHVKKWKTDLEFIANNLFANSRYLQQYTNGYEFVQRYFEFRPRQFLITTNFKKAQTRDQAKKLGSNKVKTSFNQFFLSFNFRF